MVNHNTLGKRSGIQLDFGFQAPAPQQPILKTPLDWFESWLDYRSSSANRLSPEAAEPYRYIWSAWCKWLLCQLENKDQDWATSVLAASPGQAMDFLAGQVKPATQRAGSPTEISIVTRERYCMVLREIYAHLERQGLIARNPMQRLYALAGDDRPDAEIVPEQVLVWLREKCSRFANSSSFETRDRALMLLMLDLALTPGELAALRMSQLSEDAQTPGYWLSIEGGRAAQRRQLRADGQVASALAAWLQLRSHALAGASHTVEAEDLVFFTERRRPLSRRVLFHLTSGEITAACNALDLPLPRHLGPLVLRNTAILGWIRQGMPAEEVCRRAGYQGSVSLEHLRAYLD